ncbi:MAG: CDP-alcohol phosphatidyltransferase family protein [Candidatus Nealsonbacteria bacterium]|nr:CDP-alcohol phosphatidyltransferase family protein [Candidatus Nealsonbacteria bacterium]
MLTEQIRNLSSGITTTIGKTIGKTGLSPNFFTFLVLVFGIIAAFFIYFGSLQWAVLFIMLSGLLDGIDGAVAKANNKETKFGALFDSVTDKITEISWYIALGFLYYLFWPPATMAISFFMLSSYISKHAKAVGGKSGGGIMERKERLILIIIGLVVINWMIYILYLIAFLSFITCLQRFFKNYKILKEIK